jgi:hypothetical protein
MMVLRNRIQETLAQQHVALNADCMPSMPALHLCCNCGHEFICSGSISAENGGFMDDRSGVVKVETVKSELESAYCGKIFRTAK